MPIDGNEDKRGRGRPPLYTGLIPHTIYLRPEQKKFLKENPQFSISPWIRHILDKRIEDEVFLLSRY